MRILWHWELHKDYSKFPVIDYFEHPELTATSFNQMEDQCRSFELWRQKQKREYELSVYMSHFDGFISPAFEDDFFDFRCNIADRRYQSFYNAYTDNTDNEITLLFSPGLLLEEDFDIEPWIEKAEQEQRLIVLTDNTGELLSGIWLIPKNILEAFSHQGRVDIAQYSSDIDYWLDLANTVKEIGVFEVSGFSNYLPQFAKATKERSNIQLDQKEYISTIPEWSDNDFDEWISKQSFRFARSMRWCPHEYIYMWDRELDDQKNYLMALDYVHRNAQVDRWKDRFQLALIRDGHKYWYVKVIDLLNRTSRELERRIYLEDGKDEFGRKLQNNLFEEN